MADQNPLNCMSVVLSKVINAAFGRTVSDEEWEVLRAELQSGFDQLSNSQRAYSRIQDSSTLPQVWFLRDAYGT